ncbi:MAG TPA: Gfo/Idh/MocA family oxidoreductase [Prolixibacteraceae bacterium]
MKKFALIGASGFIAPRHLKAIKETGNKLVAALDPFDSVGILDSYFPEASFFTEFERFDRHLELLKRRPVPELVEGCCIPVPELVEGCCNPSLQTRDSSIPVPELVEGPIDYVTVCTPNYLHDAHIRFGLRVGADVICEKPLVLNPWNIEALAQVEKETGRKVYNILQLRLHPSIIALKKRVCEGPADKTYNIDLTYITARGKWYYTSWKGDVSKSGGIATNIGVHFYDMLTWVFGEVRENIVHVASHDRVSGFLQFKNATVRYFLSINEETLPAEIRKAGKRTYRLLEMDGEEIEFSDGFTDLHTESYKQILSGNGFPLMDAMPSIQLVHDIRHAKPVGLKGEYHPLARLALTPHPFHNSRVNG